MTWYERPFAGVLVDPDGVVSSIGLPSWDGLRKGLQYPDSIIAVDGEVIPASNTGPFDYRARVWDRAIERAAREGRTKVHVQASTVDGPREIDLAISRFDPLAWWLHAGGMFLIGFLYVLAALVAFGASPQGKLSRTFAKTTLFAALFLFTLFDYHTTRRLVPLFLLAFAMVPMGFFALSLRLPDDVPALERHPWIVRALDGLGLALGLSMIGVHLSGGSTAPLRLLCSVLFAASFFFFAVVFLARYARAQGDRRQIMRALLVAMVPPHVILGTAFVLASLNLGGATVALCTVPALALTPFSSLSAFIRHDLWGSRALLSRLLTRVVIVAVVGAASVALGTAFAALFDVPIGGALLAAAAAGLAASLVVEPALRFGDRALFPTRAVYKPTIEQLSEELTLSAIPDEVARSVERTVRRCLPCEWVELRLLGDRARDSSAPVSYEPPPTSGVRPILGVGEAGERSSKPPSVRFSQEPGGEELMVDVLFQATPFAVLRVGRKKGGALFTSEDIDLLKTIANQAALALAYAHSYAELELRRRQQADAWRGEREALVETVAAEIAHEIRYPINFFRSIFLRGSGGQRLDDEEIEIGCEEIERLERLVSGLRRVATRRLEPSRVSVVEIVTRAERLLRDQLGSRRLSLAIVGAPVIRCDPDQVMQVLVNLLSNALDAAGPSGEVGVTWTWTHEGTVDDLSAALSYALDPRARQGGTLTVWDTGPGFEGDPSRLFAPWYTTKPRGTGLGLAITHRIVRAHGWAIEPVRAEGRTSFVLTIPRADIVAPVSVEAGVEVA